MKKYIHNEKGLTLVEILASFVILSILIIAFLTLFGQSAKQNRLSEEVMDATYIAQRNMEEIYAESQSYTFESYLVNHPETKRSGLEDSYTFSKEENDYTVVVKLKEPNDGKRNGSLLVEVYDSPSRNKLKAQMETILLWR